MFTTVAATSDTDQIEIWEGMFNDDTYNNVPPDDTPPHKTTEGHPLQASLKTHMAKAKGDKQKQQKENTTVSKGTPGEYNRITNHDLFILTKRVQSRQKCRAPSFLDPSKSSKIHKQTPKDPKLRRITRKRKPHLQLLALQPAATLLANKKP
eukprot:2430014-Ditylum_brightwellii.AAC.1